MDDRSEFTNKRLFPEGVTTLCHDIPKQLTGLRLRRT